MVKTESPGAVALPAEFRLLGDVEVRIGGHIADIGHARQRCVLAALLVDANRVVPADRLIHRVWTDDAPLRSRETLYSYLSRLRHVLAPADVRITHRSEGYVLLVDPMAVDLHRFRRLVEQARAADDDDVRVAWLEHAIALCRGPALGGLDTTWVNSVRDAVDRERVAAELDRNDIALRRGRHAELLAELTTSADARPLDERLSGQLMIALYRCGRQADALEHYQQLRSRLANDLGVDPSPSLQRLHRQILTHDEDLAVGDKPSDVHDRSALNQEAPPGGGRGPAITNVALPTPRFTGRDVILGEIRRRLLSVNDSIAVETLYGLGGIGKTQIALQYARRYAADYQLIWWIDAEQPLLIPTQLADLATRLGLAPGLSAADTVQRAMADLGRRNGWLLIFDNANHPSDIAGYRPHGFGHVLVTSRFPGWGSVGGRIEIDVLDRTDTVAMIRSTVPGIEPDIADDLAAELGDLPLAVAQAAAYMEQTGLPAEDYLHRFRTRRSAALLAHGDVLDYQGRVDTTWALSLERLNVQSPATVALLLISAFLGPEPIPLALFTGHPEMLDDPLRSIAADSDSLADTVGALIKFSLARRRDGGFQLHRLLQAVVRNRVPTNDHAKLITTAVRLLSAAAPGDPYDPAGWPAYAQLTSHILTTCPLADRQSSSRQLMLDTTVYFYVRGDMAASRLLAEEILERWRPILGADHPHTIAAAAHLTSALNSLGENDTACALGKDTLERSHRVLGLDHPISLRLTLNLTIALNWFGETTEAYQLGADNLDRFRRILGPDSPDTLRLAANVAMALTWQGHTERARAIGDDALQRSRTMLGAEHPITLIISLVSATYQSFAWKGDLTTDRGVVERAVENADKILGPDHHTTLGLAAILTLLLVFQRDSKTAHLLGMDTYDRSRKNLGPDHLISLAASACLALALVSNGDVEQARTLGAASLDRCHRRFGPDHPISLFAATALTLSMASLGETEQAVTLGRETLHRSRALLGKDHPITMTLADSLGAAGTQDPSGRRPPRTR